MSGLGQIQVVLLDIEGTICPIEFVQSTLFPYAITALPDVLKHRWNDPEFIQYRDAFPAEARVSPAALEAHVKDLTAKNVKIAYLKNLQGFLWQAGYEIKAYSTPLYNDVLPAMQGWHGRGIDSMIYSSGSVFAQKLLFAHIQEAPDSTSTFDRRDLIEAWFDTVNAGPKTARESYEKIASEIGRDAGRVLFLSDNVREVKAAIEAGMRAIVVDRPGNAELSKEDRLAYRVISSFEEFELT